MPAPESPAAAAASTGRDLLANTSPWPGSTAFQPNFPSLKRAKATELAAGSAPEMRRVVPRSPSCLTTASEIAEAGPST